MSEPPVLLQYEGEGDFRAVNAHAARLADRSYTVGEQYRMAPFAERSQASHNHEFAVIADLFDSLPERFENEPWAQSAEHMRKFALVMTGYCDTTTFTCDTVEEAERWAMNLAPLDEYSVVRVEGTTVQRFTAKSQSRRAMGGKLFQESKTAVLEYLEDLLGVDRGDAQRSAA